MFTFCRFCVSSVVMNWSGVSDDSLFTKCTISWDLLASPLSPLGFLSSTVPLPLLITSFFFCPHLLRLLTAMQTARIKARAKRDARMISHSGIWGFLMGPEVVLMPPSGLPFEWPADSDPWVVWYFLLGSTDESWSPAVAVVEESWVVGCELPNQDHIQLFCSWVVAWLLECTVGVTGSTMKISFSEFCSVELLLSVLSVYITEGRLEKESQSRLYLSNLLKSPPNLRTS